MIFRSLAAVALAIIIGIVMVTLLAAAGMPWYTSTPVGLFVATVAVWPFVTRIKPIPFVEWLGTNAIGWLVVGTIMFFVERPQ